MGHWDVCIRVVLIHLLGGSLSGGGKCLYSISVNNIQGPRKHCVDVFSEITGSNGGGRGRMSTGNYF